MRKVEPSSSAIEIGREIPKAQDERLQNPHRGFDSRRRLSRTLRLISRTSRLGDGGQTLVLRGRITGCTRDELLAYLAAGEQTTR